MALFRFGLRVYLLGEGMDTKFLKFCKMLNSNIRFTVNGPPRVPFKDSFDAPSMRTLIESAAGLLPVAYQKGYAKPLAAKLPRLVRGQGEELQALDPNQRIKDDATPYLEALLGAIYDHENAEVRKPLQRFLAVTSNLYRSFLDRTKRTRA